MKRRGLLGSAMAAALAARPASALSPARPDDAAVHVGRRLFFPRDHGAHPGARIEWWYATGWLAATAPEPVEAEPQFGFQITFFRSRTGLADTLPGRFAPRQLLFAHAAVTDLAGRRHVHAQRIARWSGDEQWPEAHAHVADTALRIGRWRLDRQDQSAAGRYRAVIEAPESGLALDLQFDTTQPLLLQGDAGFSRKGPLPTQASHYYSQPQLAVTARLALTGASHAGGDAPLRGRGWLDHEWSNELLAPQATGWDWIGINLADGGALTAFVLRRGDGSALWAGGSHRPAGGMTRTFNPDEVQFTPLREWRSPQSGARYPVQWRIATPAGEFELRALLDAQELDSRASTGAVYWEGLAELRRPGSAAAGGTRVGLGYLEMTGRFSPLRLG